MNLVLDALSMASHNVVALLNRKLEVPPVPVKTIRKQDDNVAQTKEELPPGFRLPKNTVEVFGVYKIFVEENKDDVREAYVVVSADNVMEGYKKGEWENVEYRGFYVTIEEAENEVNGYLR
jgi:hypothetical protein